MVESTWLAREVPVLEAIADGEAEDVDNIDNDWIINRTGLTARDISRAMRCRAR